MIVLLQETTSGPTQLVVLVFDLPASHSYGRVTCVVVYVG